MSLDPADLADVPVERSPEPKRPLDELVDFPCVFTFKIVGLNEGDFLDDICATVAESLNTASRHLKTSFRDRGKYRSITLRVPVNNANQIYDVYAAIDEVCVKTYCIRVVLFYAKLLGCSVRAFLFRALTEPLLSIMSRFSRLECLPRMSG